MVTIKEDFLIDGGIQSNESNLLLILMLVLGVICLLSVVGYIIYLRYQQSEYNRLSETDERYLAIFDVRKHIKLVTKNLRFLDKRSKEFREE